MTQKVGSITVADLLVELRDERKATVEYLFSGDGKCCWQNTSVNIHKAGLRKIAVDDPAESSFGGTTRQLQYYDPIRLTNVGGVDQVKRKRDLLRGFEKSKGKMKNTS